MYDDSRSLILIIFPLQPIAFVSFKCRVQAERALEELQVGLGSRPCVLRVRYYFVGVHVECFPQRGGGGVLPPSFREPFPLWLLDALICAY